MKRFARLVQAIYAPGLHLAFAAAWFIALHWLLRRVLVTSTGEAVPLAFASLIQLVLLGFVVLFFLRVVDELKDEAYDRIHHPARPLPAGLVSRRYLAWTLAVTATIALALAAALGVAEFLIAAIDLAWAVGLMRLERFSARVRDGMLLNLLVTYPVNVALSVLVYVNVLRAARDGTTEVVEPWPGVLVVVAFAFAFLHFELSRKIAWPEAAAPDERLYSRALGARPAIVIACGLAFAAVAVVEAVVLRAVLEPHGAAVLLLAPCLVPAGIAVTKFWSQRAPRLALRPFAMAFLTLFYVGVIGLAAAV